MTTGVGNALFLDTNILVYASVAAAPLHTTALRAIRQYRRTRALWISRQILREYMATVTRPQTFSTASPATDVIRLITFFEHRLRIAEDTSDVTAHLLTLLQQIPMGGKQIHDANIVATMQAYGITHLLTHNVADFTRFQPLITIVPL
jgi:predicted nucleic acid-binding protein